MILRFALTVIALSSGLNAQNFPSHVAMDALLDIRFFPEQGRFMMATSVPVLFPPAGETKARLLIKKVGGSAVVTKNMIVEPWPPHAAFGNLKPADGQMSFGPIPAGDYVMSVEMNGKEISAYSFSLAAEQGGDPFNPKNSLVRTGPWSKGGVSDRPGRGYGAIGGSGHLAEYPGVAGIRAAETGSVHAAFDKWRETDWPGGRHGIGRGLDPFQAGSPAGARWRPGEMESTDQQSWGRHAGIPGGGKDNSDVQVSGGRRKDRQNCAERTRLCGTGRIAPAVAD